MEAKLPRLLLLKAALTEACEAAETQKIISCVTKPRKKPASGKTAGNELLDWYHFVLQRIPM